MSERQCDEPERTGPCFQEPFIVAFHFVAHRRADQVHDLANHFAGLDVFAEQVLNLFVNGFDDRVIVRGGHDGQLSRLKILHQFDVSAFAAAPEHVLGEDIPARELTARDHARHLRLAGLDQLRFFLADDFDTPLYEAESIFRCRLELFLDQLDLLCGLIVEFLFRRLGHSTFFGHLVPRGQEESELLLAAFGHLFGEEALPLDEVPADEVHPVRPFVVWDFCDEFLQLVFITPAPIELARFVFCRRLREQSIGELADGMKEDSLKPWRNSDHVMFPFDCVC